MIKVTIRLNAIHRGEKMPENNSLTGPLLPRPDSDAKLDVKVGTLVDEKKSVAKFIPHVAFEVSEEKLRTSLHSTISELKENARIRTRFMDISTAAELKKGTKITDLVRLKVNKTFPNESKTKKEQLINASLDLLDDNSSDCAQTTEQNKLIKKDSEYVHITLTGGDAEKMQSAKSLKAIEGRAPHVVRENESTIELVMDERYKLATPDQTKSIKPDDQPDLSARIIVRAQFDEKGMRKENLVTREYIAHTPAGLERLNALKIPKLTFTPAPYKTALRKAQDTFTHREPNSDEAMSAAMRSDTLDTQARLIAKYYTNMIQSLRKLKELTPNIDHSKLIEHYQTQLDKLIRLSNKHGLRYEFYNTDQADIPQRDQIQAALPPAAPKPSGYRQQASATSDNIYYNSQGERIINKNALISDTTEFLAAIKPEVLTQDAKMTVDHFDQHFADSSDAFNKSQFMDGLPKNPKKTNQGEENNITLQQFVRSCVDSKQASSTEKVGQVRDNDGFDFLHTNLIERGRKDALSPDEQILLEHMNLIKASADLNLALNQANHYIKEANDNRNKIIIPRNFSHLVIDDFITFDERYNKVRTNFDLYPELDALRDMLHEYCEKNLTWTDAERLEKITELHKHITQNGSEKHFFSHPAQKMMIGLSRKVRDELDFVSAVLPTLPGQREEHRKHVVPKPDVTFMTRMVSYMQTRPISSSLLIGIIIITSIAAIILFAWPAIAAAVGASIPAFLTTALSSTFQGISIVAAGYIAAGASFILSGIVNYFSTKKTPTVEVRFDSEKDKATSNVGIAHVNWGSETYMPKHAKAQIFINAFLQGKIKPNNPESKILNDIFVDRNSKDSIEIREFIATNNDLFEQVKQYPAIAALRKSPTGNTEKNTAPATMPSDKASAKALSKVGLLGGPGARAAASREGQPSPVDPDEQRTEETTPRPGGRTNSGK